MDIEDNEPEVIYRISEERLQNSLGSHYRNSDPRSARSSYSSSCSTDSEFPDCPSDVTSYSANSLSDVDNILIRYLQLHRQQCNSLLYSLRNLLNILKEENWSLSPPSQGLGPFDYFIYDLLQRTAFTDDTTLVMPRDDTPYINCILSWLNQEKTPLTISEKFRKKFAETLNMLREVRRLAKLSKDTGKSHGDSY